MNCIVCNTEIPERRVQFLIENNKPPTCLQHSKEERLATFMVYDHKTAGHLVVVPNNPDGTNDKESIRIAKRAYERSR